MLLIWRSASSSWSSRARSAIRSWQRLTIPSGSKPIGELTELTPAEVYRVDAEGVRSANVLLVWLDGPSIDDGTACEIGLFAELVERDERRYRGIVGLVTDLRLERRRGNAAGDGMNLFVAGAIEACGRICWSVDEAVEALRELESQPR